jgi:predicted TPR repeat methyltransferase
LGDYGSIPTLEEVLLMLQSGLSRIESQLLTPEQTFELACQLLSERKPADAERLCRSLLESRPDWPDVLNVLAVARVQREGASQECVDWLQRAISLDPQHVDAHNNLGNVFKLLDRTDEAVNAYRRALALKPDNADTHSNLGIIYSQQQRLSKAVKSLREAIRRNPRLVPAHFHLGQVLRRQHKHLQAIKAFQSVLKLDPDFLMVYRPLGVLLYRMNRRRETLQLYREWVRRAPDSPEAQHMLAACSGEAIPERAADAYVKTVFDRHAATFDDNLDRLEYQAPQRVTEIIAAQGVTDLAILDAGCGTGLCGPLLKPYAQRLVGVDLSPGMLEKAQSRAVYDELVEAELTAFLEQQVDAYDAIISADTLCYFGRLDEFSKAAASALRSGGQLVFTVEYLADAKETSGFLLGESGRYAHSETYVRDTLVAAGFAAPSINRMRLRMEAGRWVIGLVVAADSSFL